MKYKIFLALGALACITLTLKLLHFMLQEYGVENIKVEIYELIALSFAMGIIGGICLSFAIIIIIVAILTKKSDIEIDQIGQ